MPKKKPAPPADTRFPQTGAPITRELWLDTWPISKAGNEWVRAFDATYTIKEQPPELGNVFDVAVCKLTVVGPGGVRHDRTFEKELSVDDVKQLLWPEGRDCPHGLADLVDGVML